MLRGLFTVALVALGNALPCHGSSPNRDSVLWEEGSRPGFGNCTIEWFEQPLDHFNGKAGARSSVTTFKQRVCIYDNFRKPGDESPTMLFYTGNESPVDLYVNNTGIMWTLGVELSAVLVFAEHRYFGESIPELQGVENCMSYLTSTQALADFAVLVPALKTRLAIKEEAPVVAFGGSYGGMLAAWFRIKYPNVCNAGAVAGSAPIWGFASTEAPLDGAFQAISLGAETPDGQFSEQCQDSFLASWLVLKELMADASGRELASDILRTCQPIRKGDEAQVLASLQDVLFLLAESNFPFPSDYIVFSVINKRGYALPAWPMRQVCKRVSRTQDEVHLIGNRKAVQYKLEIGQGKTGSKIAYDIDWDKALPIGEHVEDRLDFLKTDQLVHDMIAAVRDVYSMIYNITGENECFDLSPYDENVTNAVMNAPVQDEAGKRCSVDTVLPLDGWGAIVCNEGMVMVQDTARGIGNDMYWPPNVGRGEATQNYTKLVVESNKLGYCAGMASKGLQGVTSDPGLQDPLATWIKAEYGGHEIHKYASNIIFSNGRYDPWSQAGVLESQSASLEAIVLQHGGHHSDFMFNNIDDPESLREARNKEMEIIKGWLQTPLGPKQGPRTISVTFAVILIIASVLVVEFARSRYVAFRSRTSTEDTSDGDYTRI